MAAGDAEAVAAAKAEAIETATRLGAKPLKTAVEKLPEVSATKPGPTKPPYSLTPREWEIYRLLVVESSTNYQIARRLGIVETTVATHVHRLYPKLDVPNRAAAIRKAYEERLFEGPPGTAPTAG